MYEESNAEYVTSVTIKWKKVSFSAESSPSHTVTFEVLYGWRKRSELEQQVGLQNYYRIKVVKP